MNGYLISTRDQPGIAARLFEAAVELMTWCARHRLVLLCLEDLHRADAASVALLAYVGRRLGDLPAMIVATRREAPASPDLDAAIDAFRDRGLLHADVTLGPMGRDEIAAIIEDVAPGLSSETAERLAAAADGNPLLAREAARAAGAGGEPFDGIRSAVRTPVRRLPPPARLLVEIAATAARPLERREAAEAVGAEAVDDAYLAASEAGLLEVADRQVRFVHELVRQACYAELSQARREWLHARIAELLSGRGGAGAAAEVARHLRLAGDHDGARPHLVAAAAHAQALGALDEAAAFLREALEIPTPDRSEEIATWFALAEVEGWRERRDAMDDAFDRGLALITVEPDPRALAGAHAARGHLLRTGLCYPRESLAAYRRALETVAQSHEDLPEIRVLALAGIAWGEATVGDPACVPDLVGEVARQPEADGDLVLAIELEVEAGDDFLDWVETRLRA
jgi:tetratricopeptide (TPR) repeat protein